jgi:hypothetical protein
MTWMSSEPCTAKCKTLLLYNEIIVLCTAALVFLLIICCCCAEQREITKVGLFLDYNKESIQCILLCCVGAMVILFAVTWQ